MAAAEVSRLGLALHFAHRTYSNRFARIRTTKSWRKRGGREGEKEREGREPRIYIGNACAGREEERNNFVGKIEIMVALRCNCSCHIAV